MDEYRKMLRIVGGCVVLGLLVAADSVRGGMSGEPGLALAGASVVLLVVVQVRRRVDDVWLAISLLSLACVVASLLLKSPIMSIVSASMVMLSMMRPAESA